ncbi:PREDICTED: pyridoxal-dependent decarboxylase domain-containing protein 1 isoform X2 [Ceratosolen solmsi marchali]|uniref:Pyridoxal-dependent decarboxylase domain-containing protein 1 n=1 Tax=Ceratosolen solmsi marchali TaxID=326594 RepID=A0AAJ6YSU8_9HYME|nr:PREDICTED: pyridoxal-dependent decarboxylase domain-containing protein 1 isoform X2 [Ceratosolen solmsi marchali]
MLFSSVHYIVGCNTTIGLIVFYMCIATMAEDFGIDNKSEMETIIQSNVPKIDGVGTAALSNTLTISKLEESISKGTKSEGSTWNNSSGFLSHSKTTEEIFTLIQDLIVYEDAPQIIEDGKTEPNHTINLPSTTDVAKLALISHSVSAYAMSLPRPHAQRLAGRLAADTTRWLSHIFRFVDCASSFHEDPLEGFVRVTRLAIHKKYPKYIDEGFTALATSPPLIYSSVTAPLGLVQHLCKQLSLPLHCIRPIPHNTIFGSQHSMDISVLERRLTEDSQSNTVTPLLLLAEAGSVLTGHCDNISRLRDICDKYDVWLHLRGDSLAALVLNNSTKDMSSKIADSITLPLGIWLGIPSLPVVTLYRLTDTRSAHPISRDTTLSLISGLMIDSLSRRLPTLPLWMVLQVLSRDGIVNRFKHCFLVVEELYNKIKKFNCIRLLSQKPGGESGVYTIKELLINPLNGPQLLEVVATALVFQFVPPDIDLQELQRVPPYYDKLNSWLGQILQRDIENVGIELCEIEQYGIAIRICPLESVENPPNSDDIDNVVACLEQQIDILLATVHHKETFTQLVMENDSLHLVEMPGWAGLGGVRYAPSTWVHVLTDQAKEELNNLNTHLVETLRSTDAAFSLGEGTDGLVCVRFGMVTHDTDVAELLTLVLQVGQEVEANSKLMDTMSEVVKRGIEAAQTDLERENAEKLWQDGILRHVPVVGTFVNWWSPPSKESGVRGRSLNLQAGIVESTENIYKYHMQLQPNSKSVNGSGARTPPKPQVQMPVGPDSQSHSRSSSHSSLQCGKNLQTTTDMIQSLVNEKSSETS